MRLEVAAACVLMFVAACSKGEQSTSATTATASEKKSTPPTEAAIAPNDSEPRELDSDPSIEEGASAAEIERPFAGRLCRAFERAAVAKAMGWRGLESIGNSGSHRNRGLWNCLFKAKDHPNGAVLGVSFTTTLQFMEAHLDAPYLPRAPIAGHDAVVAKHADGKLVSIQIRARDITLETFATDAGPPDEVEARLADATAKLLATLAIDPGAALRK